jgi:uncharacterized protein (TIGR02246 family)
MRYRRLLCLGVAWLGIGGFHAAGLGFETEGDEAEIRSAIQSYVSAFNSRDVEKLVDHWSPEGVYTSQTTGEQLVGHEALKQEFATILGEAAEIRLEVTTESIEFVSPNVAIESGSAKVIRAEAEPAESNYSVVYVKRDGKWLIDRVSEEEELPPPPSNFEHLKQLEWLVGNWIDQSGGGMIKTSCYWTRNQNYLVRSFTATVAGRINLTGMQFIGWDPAQEKIRSWVFDSDGGFAEGLWSQSGERWLVKIKATLPDGKAASSTSILRPLGASRLGWQQVNRVVDGELLPNLDEVVIVRQSATN